MMVTPIRIRPVVLDDWLQLEILVAEICRFHGDTIGLTHDQFLTMTIGEKPPVTVLVAETEDRLLVGFVAGFATYSFQSGKTVFEIQNLYVAERFRRQRIGEVLMISIMQRARAAAADTQFKLGALNWNEAAISFYSQLGFTKHQRTTESVSMIRTA